MKKILIFLAIALTGTALLAQPVIQVEPGSTHTFTASNPANAANFNWNLVGTAHTGVPVLGTAQTTGSITFGVDEGYQSTLTVIPASASGCLGNTRTAILEVTATVNLDYTATFSGVPASICPQSDNQAGGGLLTVTVTIGGTGSLAGLGAGTPVRVYYSLNGTPVVSPLTITALDGAQSASVQFPDVLAAGSNDNIFKVTQVFFNGTASMIADGSEAETDVEALPAVDGIF